VVYSFENKREINPYKVSYDYFITVDETGTFLEAKSFLDDLDLRLDKNVELSYEGSNVFYPSHMIAGADLADAEGKFDIRIQNVALPLFYNIKISDRKVVEVTEVSVNGTMHTAYLIKSNFQRTKYADSEIISQSNEEILDLYVEGLGNIERQRIGNQASSNGDVAIGKGVFNIILK